MSEHEKPEQGPVGGTHAAGAAGEGGQARAIEQIDGSAANSASLPADAAALTDEMLPLAIPESARRGAGKPKGSVNIRTNTTFQAAVSRYGDPLIAEVAWGNMDTGELITELRKIACDRGLKLGATVMDIVRFQADCRRAALPYGHAKRAAVDGDGKAVPEIPIIAMGNVTVRDGGKVVINGMSIDDEIPEENPKVIDHEPK